MKEDSYTWQEISSQPKTWRLTANRFNKIKTSLADYLASVKFNQILVIGCGSTYYLSQTVAKLISEYSGIPANSSPSSDLYFFPHMTAPSGTLLVALSRSGTTTETIWALERFREEIGGPSIVVTCYPDKGIANLADFVLAAPDAQERSIAQTRSFSSMLLLSYGLVSQLADDPEIWEQTEKLPDRMEDIVKDMGVIPQKIGEQLDIDHYVFLGSGPFYGLANEAMLKTKEISLTYSEGYHSLEVRHGPMSMVNDRTLVVGLLSDTGQNEQVNVLEDMKELGAKTLIIAENSSRFSGFIPDYQIELNSGLEEWVRGPLYLPILQRIVYHRAITKGLDPDKPTNLEAVVKLTKANES